MTKANGGFGFRDIWCFNKALLAMQVWHVILNPNSLIVQTLRYKYFSKNSILEAILGTRLSFLWRNLVDYFLLIRDGMCWRVGNEQSIKIWDDKWLLIPSSYSVQSTVNTLHNEDRVCKLIDETTRGWNMTLVHQIFHPEEANIISSIYHSQLGAIDRIIWLHSKLECS